MQSKSQLLPHNYFHADWQCGRKEGWQTLLPKIQQRQDRAWRGGQAYQTRSPEFTCMNGQAGGAMKSCVCVRLSCKPAASGKSRNCEQREQESQARRAVPQIATASLETKLSLTAARKDPFLQLQ